MISENENTDENLVITYTKENSLMNMISVPYFGIYSPNYTFYIPINVMHSNTINENIFNTFPSTLQKHFQEMRQNFHNLELDYFVVTLDGSFLCSKYCENTQNGFLRVNFVPHPYIFYDITNLEKDHKTTIFSCLYSDDDSGSTPINYIRETNEFDGLRINPNPNNKLICEENKKEVILHKSNDNSPALSPNNCSFLLNIYNSHFTLFNVTCVTYKNNIVKFMIAQYNFLNYNDINLFSTFYFLNNASNFNSIETITNFVIDLQLNKELISFVIKNVFSFFCSKILMLKFDSNKEENAYDLYKKYVKENIKNIFYHIIMKNPDMSMNMIMLQQLQQSQYQQEELVFNDEVDTYNKIVDFYYDDLCFFLWNNFDRPNIPDLGESLLFSEAVRPKKNTETENDFLVEILMKYSRKKTAEVNRLINSYVNIIKGKLGSKLKLNEEKIKDEVQVRFNKSKEVFLNPYFKAIDVKNEYENFMEICKNLIEKFENNKKTNPALILFREILEESFNLNFDNIKSKINDLDLTYQNMLYYKVWEHKGKIQGVHKDFGRLSFIRSNQIPSNYLCEQDEIVEIVLEMIGTLEAFDNK